MISRLGFRRVSVALYLSVLALLLALDSQAERARAAGAQGAPILSYCHAGLDPAAPAVYFSGIFDTKLEHSHVNGSGAIAGEFNEYLIGRYDYNANSGYPAGCPFFATTAAAEQSKRELEARTQQGKKQIVEVNWDYIPALVASAASVSPATRSTNHTFCVSQPYEGAVYFSDSLDTSSVNLYLWQQGFTQFLTQKYSFKGRVYCNVVAGRLLNARLEGARAANRKVVDTGWKYEATTAATSNPTTRPAAKDDDREPTRKAPAAQSPSLQARDFATKEMPVSFARCSHDPMIGPAFDCYCVQRAIYTYRINHANDTVGAAPEPLENLFNGDKLDCTACIVDFKVKIWVKALAQSQRLGPTAANCAAEKFVTLLRSKPFLGPVNELLNQAVKACNK